MWSSPERHRPVGPRPPRISVSVIMNKIKSLMPYPPLDTARRLFLIGAASALAACGFQPVYAPGGLARELQGVIIVAEPTDRNSFVFVARLEERLGQPQAPRFLLAYDIDTDARGVGITPAQEITRYNLFGTVRYTLTDRATDTIVFRGEEENFTGYSATSLIVGTQSVTRDANERLMVALADQIVTRLIATGADWRR